MSELKLLLSDIEELRANLEKIIEQNNSSLSDPEVVFASQLLNATITKYNELIKRKLNS